MCIKSRKIKDLLELDSSAEQSKFINERLENEFGDDAK